MVPLNAISLVGGALLWGIGRIRAKREAEAAAAVASRPLEAPSFEDPDDVLLFTETLAGERHFQADIKRGLAPLLDMRSLEMIPPQALASDPEEVRRLASLGTYYLVVPLEEGLANAGQVVRECEKAGAVVCGSLTLILLPSAADYPMVLIVGGKALRASTDGSGESAILYAPPLPSPPAEASPPVVEAPPEPKPPETNGAPPRYVVYDPVDPNPPTVEGS
jgi:hypothetical protein